MRPTNSDENPRPWGARSVKSVIYELGFRRVSASAAETMGHGELKFAAAG
jgi:hypothetical protein